MTGMMTTGEGSELALTLAPSSRRRHTTTHRRSIMRHLRLLTTLRLPDIIHLIRGTSHDRPFPRLYLSMRNPARAPRNPVMRAVICAQWKLTCPWEQTVIAEATMASASTVPLNRQYPVAIAEGEMVAEAEMIARRVSDSGFSLINNARL